MLIRLPPDKVVSWSHDIKATIEATSITKQDLDTLIGRLNHVGYIIPQARHFLNRLRSALNFAENKNRRRVKLTRHQLDDLRQWLLFINQADEGISLNNITYRTPSTVLRGDACPFGMGGVSLSSGTAWRYELPPELQGRVSLNCLEYLASYVSILVEDYYHGIPDLSCVHSQGDSTSASGWLHKSNFSPTDDLHDTHIAISRRITEFIMDKKSCLSSQWFPGKHNSVADCLSRDFHLSKHVLTLMLRRFAPEQLPANFVIRDLPNEISSAITSLLQCSKQTTVLSEQHTRSSIATGVAGKSFLRWLISGTTPSSTTSPGSPEYGYLPDSPAPSETESSALTTAVSLYLEQSRPPWTTWRRGLGITTGLTHDTMPQEKQRTFFNARNEAI